ncbi:MAG: cupin domain-containing protein [Protaetiibacter sp.]
MPDDTTEGENLSILAAYSGETADRSRVGDPVAGPDGDALARFREIMLHVDELDWVDKTLGGLAQKMLWRNDTTGASIALVRFLAGSGIPSRHAHASNQFMFCLSGRYSYLPSGITLETGSFYWNPQGSSHGPTLAHEDTVLLEIYDGPHYPTQPEWYTSAADAH